MSLSEALIREGWLKTPRIIRAFKEIKRIDFLPEDMKDLADLNEALPVGYGQTISQPLVVAFMLELLQPGPGNVILDIGSGSGWTSALLAEIVGKRGKVTALEIVPQLKEFGEKNAVKYGSRAQFVLADGYYGYKKEAPYNGILSSAAVSETIPEAWKQQLKIEGRIVAPVDSSINLYIKKNKGGFSKKEHSGFVFVPLVNG